MTRSDHSASIATALSSDELSTRLEALSAAPRPVCVVGSLNADLTVRVERLPGGGETVPGSELETLPGGKSANQAATVGKLGVPVQIIGAVGKDANGDLLLESLQEAGVSTGSVDRVDTATGTAMIVVDEQAENFIVISAGANGTVSAESVESHRDAIESAGSLGLCLEVGNDAIERAARIAHDAGVPVVFNLSPIREVSDEFLSLVDVLIVNEHELAALVGEEAAVAGAVDGEWELPMEKLAAAHGITQVVVTLGGAGSVVLERSEAAGDEVLNVTSVAALPISVVDTTGCGDSYMGTLLAGIAAELSLAQAAQVAAFVSAYAATGSGAQRSYGTAAEIAEFSKKHLA